MAKTTLTREKKEMENWKTTQGETSVTKQSKGDCTFLKKVCRKRAQ